MLFDIKYIIFKPYLYICQLIVKFNLRSFFVNLRVFKNDIDIPRSGPVQTFDTRKKCCLFGKDVHVKTHHINQAIQDAIETNHYVGS